MKTKQTVLIVDDVKENIDILVDLLKEHDLVTALDASTALEVLKEEDIDLILLDIMMPDMDGFELCEIIKSDINTLHIPVIFLSAKDKSEDIQKGFILGAVDYVTKPFEPLELLSRVDTHLKLRAYEKSLEVRVQEELEKNRLKQQMLYQHSKQAALGELLMHIAHQWKQPLASLGSINLLNLSKIRISQTLSMDELSESIEKSEGLISFMSQTIETFQEFYKPTDINESFYLNDCLLNVLSIVEATFNFHNIEIFISSSETEKTFANANEISQVIFSILNNARDVFKDREVDKPKIHIEIQNQKISISDNAGGIEDSIFENIFLPFVSNKSTSGFGLFLSKGIAEKNSAILSAKNESKGATFILEFITWIS